MKSQLNGKDSGVGKDWRQEEKGADEDEMVQQHKEKIFGTLLANPIAKENISIYKVSNRSWLYFNTIASNKEETIDQVWKQK